MNSTASAIPPSRSRSGPIGGFAALRTGVTVPAWAAALTVCILLVQGAFSPLHALTSSYSYYSSGAVGGYDDTHRYLEASAAVAAAAALSVRGASTGGGGGGLDHSNVAPHLRDESNIPVPRHPDGSVMSSAIDANARADLPIIVVGMPKAGTTTITEFFKCADRYNVSHLFCNTSTKRGEGKCGVIIRSNVHAGRPPLEGTGNFDVYAQLDAWALFDPKYDYHCYLPQVEILEHLHAQYPRATWLLNTRNVSRWVRSLHSYNNGKMLKQMIQCNITSLPAGKGDNDFDLQDFFIRHLDRVRSFVASYRSHKLVEVDIESPDAALVMEKAFRIDRKCWGHANKSIKLSAHGSQ